jgi:hypothetical protein
MSICQITGDAADDQEVALVLDDLVGLPARPASTCSPVQSPSYLSMRVWTRQERGAALAEARVEDDDGLREVQRGDGEVLGVLALRAEALGRGVLSGPEKLLRDEGRVDLSLPAGQDLRADLRDGAHGRSHRRCHPHPWR